MTNPDKGPVQFVRDIESVRLTNFFLRVAWRTTAALIALTFRLTILGALPLEGAQPRTLPFRIEGEIAKGSKRRWAQDERFGSWVPGAALTTCI